MRGLGATSLVGGGGPQLPLTRLLVHFDTDTMPPVDERGATYTVIDSGQALVSADARFGERCLHNNRGCGYFTPVNPNFYRTGTEDWCLEFFVKLDHSEVEGIYKTSDNNAFLVGTYEDIKTPRTVIGLYNMSFMIGHGASFRIEGMTEDDKWVHVAFYENNDRIFFSKNGKVLVSEKRIYSKKSHEIYFFISTPKNKSIPGYYWENSYGVHGIPLLGHLDELRYSVGTSRYGPNDFTPPSSPFVLD